MDAGLFGYVGSGGTVQNLAVDGAVTVKDFVSSGGASYVGGVAGYNAGNVLNCSSTVVVSGTYNSYAGGVVGYNKDGSVKGCSNTGSVSADRGNSYAGGVVGYNNNGNVKGCSNTGNVSAQNGSDYAGGVAGYNTSSGTLENCYNTGSVTANCNDKSNWSGGVAGFNFGTVKNCYNTGAVTANGGSVSYAGGVVGSIDNSSTVENCYNTGAVKAADGARENFAGGVAGFNDGSVQRCSNAGEVTASDGTNCCAGGVAGYNYGTGTVQICYNTGAVSVGGSGNAGGVAGYNYNRVENCYNTGAVSVGGSGSGNAGGVAGSNFDGTVKNCYNIGAVSAGGSGRAGGLVGLKSGTVTVSNAYYDSDMAPGLSPFGAGSSSNTVKGLTTAEMTGHSALTYLGFSFGEGQDNPWLTKADSNGYWFYPHLKGFAYDSDGSVSNWPAKATVTVSNALSFSSNITYDGNDHVSALAAVIVNAPNIPEGVSDVYYYKWTENGWQQSFVDSLTDSGLYRATINIRSNTYDMFFRILEAGSTGDYIVRYEKKGDSDAWSATQSVVDVGQYKRVITFIKAVTDDSGTEYVPSVQHATIETQFSIDARTVTVTGLGAKNKTYDGTTDATATGTATIDGKIQGDDVGVQAGSAAFADGNAGKNKTVKFSGYSLTGTKAKNYSLEKQPADTTADIDPKPITGATVTLSGAEYEYNGAQRSVTVTGVTLEGKALAAGDYDVTGSTTGTNADTYTVTVTGKGNYSQSASATWRITPKKVTITGLGAKNKTYDGTTDATATGTAALSWKQDGDDISIVAGSAAFADKNVGTNKTVTFSDFGLSGEDAGNYSLTAQPKSVKADITAKDVTITGLTAESKTYDGTTDATVTGTDTVTIEGMISGDKLTVVVGTAAFADKNVGTDKVVTFSDFGLSGEDAGNYRLTAQPDSAKADITQREIGLSWSDTSFTYDGKSHLPTVTATRLVENDKCDVTVSGAQTNAGSYTATAMQLSNGNYRQPKENTTNFTIAPIDNVTVTITGKTNTTVYDGKAHTVSGYTAKARTSLYDVSKDFSFTGKAEATQTDVGKTSMGLKASQFKNTNKNFSTVTFNVTDGYQTVEPLEGVVVTITGKTNTTAYDGKAHTVSGYAAEASTPLYDAKKDFTFSGKAEASQTVVGTAKMGLKASQFKNTNKNFSTVTFKVTDGYETVEPLEDVVVTITGKTNTVSYDGNALKVSGYDFKASTPLFTAKDFTFTGKAEASRTVAGKTSMGLKAEQFTNTNKNFSTVTFFVTDGYQTVEPLEGVVVTITGKTNTATYDGNAHTVSGYIAESSTALYDVSKDFTFSGKAEAKRTDAGTAYMGLKASQFKNNNPNFSTVTFNVTDGWQEITPIDSVTVTITGHTSTATYNGSEHKVSGYDFKASTPLYTAKDFTFTGKAEASQTDAGTAKMGLKSSQFANKNKNFKTVTFNVTDGWQKVNPAPVDEEHGNLGIELEFDTRKYEDKPFEPELMLRRRPQKFYTGNANAATNDDEGELIPANEYTVTYKNNINAGTAKVIITDNPGGNYIVNGEATFTIEKRAVTVTAADQTVKVNGSIQTGVKQVKASGLVKGHTLKSVKLSASSTAKATTSGKITPSGAKIVDAKGRDVTKNYDISYAKGKLTVKGNPTPAKPDYTLLAEMRTCGHKALRVTWTKVESADGYYVYFVKNDRSFGKGKVVSVTGTLTYKFSGLKKKTACKAYVQAWKYNEYGRKTSIGKASPVVCAVTGDSDKKWTNAASIKVKAAELSLRVGKDVTIKATVKGVKSGRKVKLQDCKLLRYYSTNRNVATVTGSGKVKAVGKGTCTIWVVAANGLRTAVKVKVK